MEFYKIILKSIKNNYKNYFMYMFVVTISVMVFFSFSLIQHNDAIQSLKGLNGYEKASNMIDLFKNGAIQISLFIGVFIVYCNLVFMEKRKKEIAIYSILGSKKIQLVGMLIIESLVMLIISLIIGIGLGFICGRVFIDLLIYILKIDVNIKLQFNYNAIIATGVVFTIITGIAIIARVITIYRYKLIELFKASSKPEKAPKGSIITATLSILILFNAYKLLIRSGNEKKLFIAGTVGILVGIYLLIISILIYAIKLCMKNKRNYYKNINMTIYTNILFKIKRNAITLSMIAILTGATLVNAMTGAISYFDVVNKVEKKVPFSFVYNNNGKYNDFIDRDRDKSNQMLTPEQLDKKIENTINKYSSHKIINSIKAEFLVYQVPQREGPINYFIISNSKFKEINKLNNKKEDIDLKGNEGVIFDSDYFKYREVDNNFKINSKINLKIKDYKLYDFINTNAFPHPNRKIVVSDEVYDKLYDKNKVYSVKAINIENDKNSKKLTAELLKVVPKVRMSEELVARVNIGCNFSSYYEYYNNNMIGSGSKIFLNSFLALIFLICIGSIIFFKQMFEANENKRLYSNLNKIGVTKNEVRNAIIKQMAVTIFMPVVIGIIYCTQCFELQDMFVQNVYIPKIIVLIIFIVFYVVFYIITVVKYYKIVTNYNK